MGRAKKTPAVEIEQVKGEEIPAKIIATSIVKIAKAVDDMNRSGLRRRAIVLMLSDLSQLPRRDVLRVIEAMDALRHTFTNL